MYSFILSVFKARYFLRIESLNFLSYFLTIFAAVHVNVSMSTDHITVPQSR